MFAINAVRKHVSDIKGGRLARVLDGRDRRRELARRSGEPSAFVRG